MASYFNLILDTTAPASPTISIESGATYATNQLVNLTIGTGDGITTGYTMLIWGNVDTTFDTAVQSTEGTSQWITFNTSKQVKLLSGDGSKTVFVKIRDDVNNVSAQASDSIILDTTIPIVTTTSSDVPKVSKNAGKNVSSFSFQCDCAFEQYTIRVVPATNSIYTAGTQIGVANGSTNMSGSAGNYPANTPINCTINGADLELASGGDGTKIIKIFVRDSANQWSV